MFLFMLLLRGAACLSKGTASKPYFQFLSCKAALDTKQLECNGAQSTFERGFCDQAVQVHGR